MLARQLSYTLSKLKGRFARILAAPALMAVVVVTAAASAPSGCGADIAANQHYYGTSSGGGMSAFQQCVIARESSGRPQVMNSSGHYGLYQFDLPTWESGGGPAADFGHASVAEQNQVFANVYAARGVQPWRPYDGC